MSDLDYDALRKVAEAATPGPWGLDRNDVHGVDEWQPFVCRLYLGQHKTDANGEHIATFDPPTVLRLLDLAQRAEAAEAAVEQVRALVRQGFNRGSLSWADSGDLFAALDRKEDQ